METSHCLQCKNIPQKHFILKQCKTSDWDILSVVNALFFIQVTQFPALQFSPPKKMEPIKMKFFSQIVLDVSAMEPDGLM